MRFEPRPTRAEVNDAANAVLDSVDGIMLAGETAVGAFPVKAVEMLDAIIQEAERIGPLPGIHPVVDVPTAPHSQALCEAAVTLADRGRIFAIVAITRAGHTARVLSALRPRAPIFAATDDQQVARQLVLCRGVAPIATAFGKAVDSTGALLKADLLSRGLVPRGSIIVLINADADLSRPDANYVMLQQL
jgi:pyruvate kinase